MARGLGLGYQYVISSISSLRKSNDQFINRNLGGNILVVETVVWQAVLKSIVGIL